MHLGLAGGLEDVSRDPLGVLLARLVVDRPGADEGLVQQELLVRVRSRHAVDVPLERVADRRRPPDEVGPLARQLGEHADPGPGVLAALGVVRRGRAQAVRPVALAELGGAVELVDAHRLVARIAPDLVARDQDVVDVQRGVLDALRLDGAGQLLPGQDELEPLAGLGARAGPAASSSSRIRRRKRSAGRAWDGTRASAAPIASPIVAASVCGRLEVAHVGAVDREGGRHLGERQAQLLVRQLGAVGIAAGDQLEAPAEPVEVGPEERVEGPHLVGLDEELEGHVDADEAGREGPEGPGATPSTASPPAASRNS